MKINNIQGETMENIEELNNKMFELLNKYHKTGNETNEIKTLIEQGADVNARNERERYETPLMYACGSYDYDKLGNGNLELAKFLISKGADVNAKDVLGLSALGSSALCGNVEITKLLIDNGADVNIQDSQSVTPLMNAQFVIKEKQQEAIEIAKILIENGAYLLNTDKNGKTALDYQNNKEKFPYFNADTDDNTKNDEMIKLLENAIEVADKQNRLNMALYESVENGDFQNVKDCLNRGANKNCLWLAACNIRDYINDTKAEDKNSYYIQIYLEIAEYLLQNGQTIESHIDAETFAESKEYLENNGIYNGIYVDFEEVTKLHDLLKNEEVIENQQENIEFDISENQVKKRR